MRQGWWAARGRGFGLIVALGFVMGCGSHTSSLLLERQARGPITEERAIAQQSRWVLEPATQVKTQEGVEITITFASLEYLTNLFNNQQIFGDYAGLNPYFNEQMVFYVKIANQSGKKLRVDPNEFVMLDDHGNQYYTLSPDYANALAEARAPMSTVTRGVLEEARPGYFGVGLPVGRIIGKPQRRFALMKMSTLQAGSLFHGVVYDGLIAFWSPHRDATRLRLLATNIKTDFDANDWPHKSLEFVFEFTAHRQTR